MEKLGTPILTLGWGGPTLGSSHQPEGGGGGERVGWTLCLCVQSSGEKLRSFGTCGFGQGQFNYPRGVAVDVEGNVLVADGWNHRIQKFTAEDQFLTAVGTYGNGPLTVQYSL